MINCIKCDVSKPENDFHFKNKKKGTRTKKCKVCTREYDRQYREKNSSSLKETRRIYRENNKEAIKKKKREYHYNNQDKAKEAYARSIIRYKHHCIYEIKMKKTSQCYIGETKSFKRRSYNHKSSLKNNKSCNKKLQEYYNNFGWESMEIVILEEFSKETTKLDRLKAEIKWIEKRLNQGTEVINNCN